MPPLGLIVRTARYRERLSLYDAARRVGISRQHLSNIERGLTPPSALLLKQLIHALHIPQYVITAHFYDAPDQVARYVRRHTPPRLAGERCLHVVRHVACAP